MFTIEEIVKITGGILLQGDGQASVTSVHFNSRKLEENALFIALTGGGRDGHQFLQMAQKAGASAALVSKHVETDSELRDLHLILVQDTERAFQALAKAHRQRLSIPIIAITGSNGKTTTKDMTAHILAKKLHVFKTYKNLNNHLGLPLSLLQILPEHEVAVLELGMNHAGEIDLLASIAQPSTSVITNIGDAHIGHFGSKERIAEAKGELLPHTDPNKYVLLNGDDPYVTSIAAKYVGKRYYFSTKKEMDIYTSEMSSDENGTHFELHIDQQSVSCFIPTFGAYNVANCLPGAFIAYQFGFSLAEIAESLRDLSISDMRFQVLSGSNGSILINDAYNASPTSMKAAIETFADIYPERQKVLVLGDILELGEQADELHAQIGEYLKNKAFTLITIGEKAKHISEKAAGKHCLSKEVAVEALQPYLNRNHAILFKASRGIKLEEIIHLL